MSRRLPCPRIAIDDHRHVNLQPDDVVVFSAREIPGNEKAIGRVMNHIARRGAEVVYEGIKHVHVSGHGSQEELKLMLSLVRPRYFVPIHGEYRQLSRHARVAATVSRGTKVLLAENGDLISFDGEGGRVTDKVPAGRILIDGTRSGEVGDEVLRDRRHLAGDGLVVPVVAIGRQSGALEETPDVITRGIRAGRKDRGAAEGDSVDAGGDHRRGQRGRTHRPWAHQGEDSRGSAEVLPQTLGAPAAGAAGDHGDLMAGSALSRRLSEVIGVGLFAMALIWLISLASYSASDPVWFFNTGPDLPPANFAGRIGAFIGELSFQLLGYAAYLIPIVMVVIGWHYFWCRVLDAAYTKVFGAGLLFACVAAFLSLAFGSLEVSGKDFLAGGYIGKWVAGALAEYLNRTGSIILILTLLFLATVLATQFSFGRFFAFFGQLARDRWAAALGAMRARREEARREKERQDVLKKHLGKSGKEPVIDVKTRPAAREEPKREEPKEKEEVAPAKPSRTAAMVGAAAAALKAASSKPTPAPAIDVQRLRPPRRRCPCRSPRSCRPSASAASTLPRRWRSSTHRAASARSTNASSWKGRACSKRSAASSRSRVRSPRFIRDRSSRPTNSNRTPGVKYSKVTGLADDLCLAMQAESVLIDRIPGKSTVGIQIPNPNREQISLRELLESDAYRRSQSKLTLALGKTIHGEPFVSDLATMPHLLIAGSTGTGKSVSVNAMLSSILFRASPDDVRLIMIDPKRLELGMYEDIPHLLTPVVVDPKLAANALRWAVREMEERYKTLAKVGVRNIEQYNRNIQLAQAEKNAPLVDDLGNEVKTPPLHRRAD